MRLIDADVLKENLIKRLKPLEPEEEMIDVDVVLLSTLMEIDGQPTAYDVSKVVDEILRASCTARPMGWDRKREIIETRTAIEIVKGGGN